jgi:hypothetical protein
VQKFFGIVDQAQVGIHGHGREADQLFQYGVVIVLVHENQGQFDFVSSIGALA